MVSLQPLRSVYGLALAATLFVPFGVYHSFSEASVMGTLWGYHLPVGYVGLALGLLAIAYPKMAFSRRLGFGNLMIIAGLILFAAFLFAPKDFFINLIHNTNLSPSNIDVDYPVGNLYVWALTLFSIATGIILRAKQASPKIIKNSNLVTI